MKKLLSMLLAAMLLLAACGSSPIDENQPPAVTPAVDDSVPDDAGSDPQVQPLSAMQELVADESKVTDVKVPFMLEGNEDFSPLGKLSFDLYGQTEGAKNLKNNVFSPISAAIALGMLLEGTNDETAAELETMIGWNKNDALDLFGSLMREYAEVNEQTDTTLNLANAAFFSPSLKNASDSTLMNLRDFYRAQAFRGELFTDSAREFINGWVSEKTDGEIPSVFEKNLDKNVVLVLINTILLDAKWAYPFENFGYEPKMQFTCANGETSELPCLSDTRYMKYIDTDELIGTIMDYSDSRLKFMAVKPKNGDISKLMESFDYAKFVSTVEAAQEGECDFRMPKFSIESEIDLKDCVKQLGAELIFDSGRADLSGFGQTEDGNVYVSKIFQKAKIDVDEEGTRAAAATMAVAVAESAEIVDKEIILDSSFFWCVYDGETDVPLFMGTMCGD